MRRKRLKKLAVSNDFNLATPIRGRKRIYRGYKIAIKQQEFDGIWHNWWNCKIEGNLYGMVYLTNKHYPEMINQLIGVAHRSIDKLLDKDGLIELKEKVADNAN